MRESEPPVRNFGAGARTERFIASIDYSFESCVREEGRKLYFPPSLRPTFVSISFSSSRYLSSVIDGQTVKRTHTVPRPSGRYFLGVRQNLIEKEKTYICMYIQRDFSFKVVA